MPTVHDKYIADRLEQVIDGASGCDCAMRESCDRCSGPAAAMKDELRGLHYYLMHGEDKPAMTMADYGRSITLSRVDLGH